jgi:hypothetical protein
MFGIQSRAYTESIQFIRYQGGSGKLARTLLWISITLYRRICAPNVSLRLYIDSFMKLIPRALLHHGDAKLQSSFSQRPGAQRWLRGNGPSSPHDGETNAARGL